MLQVPRESIDVRVLHRDRETQWYLRVSSNDDTVFSGLLSNDTTIVRLSAKKSYFVNFFRPDTNAWSNYHLSASIQGVSGADFVCTRGSVLVNNAVIENYSKEIENYRSQTFQIIQAQSEEKHSSKLARIDSLTDQLERKLCTQLLLTGSCADVRTHVVTPLKRFIQECQSRYSSIEQLSQLDSSTLARRITLLHESQRWQNTSLVHENISSQALYVIQHMAYSMAIRLPSVLYALLPTIRTGKNTVEMGILTSYLVGVQSPCEIAYGLLTRTTWNPGVDFSNCSEPFAQYMISVRREGDSGFHCREFDRAFENYCRSLETRTVHSIEAYDRSGSLVTRQLHADSMYVLHFWGTWCKPCIDNHEEIMDVSDSLEALGCRVLHVAYQVRQSMPAWQKFVSNVRGEQYLVATDISNVSSIVSILNVANYPSYVIIDKGNRVDIPWPYWHDAVVPRVRDLREMR